MVSDYKKKEGIKIKYSVTKHHFIHSIHSQYLRHDHRCLQLLILKKNDYIYNPV